jgi:hypothetical protein
MLKKVLCILLTVLTVIGCLTVCVSAADGTVEDPANPTTEEPAVTTPEEPEKSPSGYYVGQILKPGDKVTSFSETCETLVVNYKIGDEDVEQVTSALQKTYAKEVNGVVVFRDNIASFTSGEFFGGVYTVKGHGDKVDEMETEDGYKTALDIFNGLDKEVQKKYKKQKKEIVLKIDYEHSKTTYYQYTTITGWKVTNIEDSENSLRLTLEAVYETREPTKMESFVEKLYVKWLEFLDVLGNLLLKITPKLVSFWAKLLGNR